MKVLKCSDLGIRDSYQVTGYSDEEVINKMYVHFRKVHPDIYEEVSSDQRISMREKMKNILREQKA